MPDPQSCSVCKSLTKYTCTDCLIDKIVKVYVCEKETCRKKHNRKCTAPKTNLKYKYAGI